MKHLKTLQEEDLGFAEGGQVGVNIELIWEMTQKEETFAEEFAKTMAHELMHVLLADALGNKLRKVPVIVEEAVIRHILGEEWTEEIAAMYLEVS
ncbi:hypothetical protein HOE37_02960 [Candidatus Woesearchaeota archaeon]|mgnify:CR=1 FL=1|jgi:hypothetical protein|nr:hypothetical protein [Candidatus Woesearchaeota archaeon]MBT4110788.1 hypothetical protein [Candidatus Woesearchaeota archaeon]MBT4336700.1 hypothetical protein [Candidatus Woesearchaeota archaeon]MBT4469551.1 hypothetical protein [Candidatus Woesearchaeota archaeon]MBT6743913.1 hypothetical protein [Candidatus Woesearchaeota archaeon]